MVRKQGQKLISMTTKRLQHNHRAAYWTRERVILGLRRFVKDFGFMPTGTVEFHEKRKFTGRSMDGRLSLKAWHQKYPSTYGVGKFFKTMRDAWKAAGFDIDQGYQEWSPMEDWFVIETVGILPREEVARYTKRTVPAVKRRLYDLGRFTAHTRWGIPLSKAAHELGVSEAIVRRYLTHGLIPYFRGYKLIYLNPADLTKIVEVDWRRVKKPFRELIRKALIQRALKILQFREEWRQHEIYKFQKQEGLFTKRISGPRTPSLVKERPPQPPNNLAVGDWVEVASETSMGVTGRIGIIRAVHYSPLIDERRDGTKRKCWMARVEFPRLRRSAVSSDDRIRYSLPLDCLSRTVKPQVEPKPLSMHPEAIKGRRRFKRGVPRAAAKLRHVADQIS